MMHCSSLQVHSPEEVTSANVLVHHLREPSDTVIHHIMITHRQPSSLHSPHRRQRQTSSTVVGEEKTERVVATTSRVSMKNEYAEKKTI
ncbi:hypothetical protein BD777DRAFT_128628 [Yarrowia lipolytica]|nr:hypothetical protein BD777DRAFT_128628 [Yarrowia lipolytica]